ncbi:FAD-dependent monooxygenase yanF [Lachnellula arida]|uniref:FAD-dependent monooxygenase yanF n=1 Tax=Lachnellula arida TaxID=1316785 RepID=A0A8T9B4K2_9HELO|nr:FAD-dependent monooxygenase yanF [Lachnellula arida]
MKSSITYIIIGALFAFPEATLAEPTFGARHNVTDFQAFICSLGLPPNSKVQSLTENYARVNTSTNVLEVACHTAQISLGAGQVEISPLNQTVVNENWSDTCHAEPYCIIIPSNASHVLTAIRIIDYFEIKFVIRSGGHSPNPGWSSIGNDGILLDLERLNSISLSSDGTFASIGPGSRWGDVYEMLGADEVLVVGARIPDVGVGGLLLGGGYFYFSEQFGLAADNVKNFEVVIANGTIVDANADINEDLFWALKGGGPNFGIVTRYDLYTVPVYEIWAEVFLFSTDQAFDILTTFDMWQENGSSDVKSSVALNIALDSIIVGLIYSEPVEGPPSAFAPFYNLEPLATVIPASNMTFETLMQFVKLAFAASSPRHDYRGVSSRIDTNLTQEVYSFWLEKALDVHNATGANQTFVLQHVGPNLIQQGVQKGGNPLGLSLVKQQWWTTTIDWENPEDDDLVRSVSIQTTALWAELGQQRGLNDSFLYMNDASRDQNPLASYGIKSIDRLKQISLLYDPNQIFQNLQNGGFLLSMV